MVEWTLPAELLPWVAQLTWPLHARLAGRLAPLLAGMLLAQGRRTVAAWLRAAGLGPDYRRYYYFLGSLGRKAEWVGGALLRLALQRVAPGDRILFALDDTPTARYGPQVEGAGLHHNPTPGPAAQRFLYGHVWVTLALLVRHPLWGTIGLPLLALLYVRRRDIAWLTQWYGVAFRTKLELAAALVTRAAGWVRRAGRVVWVAVDGAYAKRPFLKACRADGVVVVSRLRKDAALWSVPPPARPGAPKRRGRPRIYGRVRISLAKRAAHRQGWQAGAFRLYGKDVPKAYKTFLATYKPAGGLIRVVVVQETAGWVAFFCTDPEATVAQILEAVADRSAIEQDFKDVKEVHGAGQQQVRHYWANVAVWHLNLWLHTLIELWAWDRPPEGLCDRGRSPWDDPSRRPSHADRRNALRRLCVEQTFRQAGGRRGLAPKFRALLSHAIDLMR